MATRKEVAELAGVSEATVSRVLNGVGPIKETTRQRVMAAAKQLNYHLNAVAASFARGKSGNIGVVLPFVPKVHLFSTYYFSELLSGVGEIVRTSGYGLLLLFRDPAVPFDYVSLFRTHRIDACIILGASSLPAETESVRRLAQEGLPFCVIDQHFEDPGVSIVSADHAAGARDAVAHLLSLGYERIGFLNGSPQYSGSSNRFDGYKRALFEAGVPLDESIVFEGNYSSTSGYRLTEQVLASRGRLDAVFAANDRMAIGLMQGLRERGLSPPSDMPIVGCDDSDASRLSDPPLTTVHVPFFQMGSLAVERLLKQLAEGTRKFSVFHEQLATRLIVRRSCGAIRTE
ncbi:LacI family DNA-binding transcriptional regulator [Paenibacillus thermotolerans]|uniref:LacI family DNA-binding transcriptional regulator n=1 Tax=Paenibacillus thermotolerans TaxID=3027807 RepID=UPI0023686A8A|nr:MULTISPECIES: LacI family DNA-binding transcriptional regulator [unclassified Paenibacillus]